MGVVLIYFGDRLPFSTAGLPGWKIAMAVEVPASIAMVIGGFVPHIYRTARLAARASAGKAGEPPAPAPAKRTIMRDTPPGRAAGRRAKARHKQPARHRAAPTGRAWNELDVMPWSRSITSNAVSARP